MEKGKNKVQLAIEEKFIMMMERTGSNVRLKNEVMSTIDKINNIATFVDLFTIKLLKTEGSVFKNFSNDFKDKN